MEFRLYDTLDKAVRDFTPLNPPHVTLYTCGFTVYDFTHIGSLRKYTNDDLLKRALQFMGYEVKHVRNVTDVGHLVSDEDAGEDKLEKGARKFGKTVWEVARYFEEYFDNSMSQINVLVPNITCRATEHIKSQIDLIKTLEQKGFTYETDLAVYFDASRFKDYGKLSGQDLAEKKTNARGDVVVDPKKKHPFDFALWVKRVGEHKDHVMFWESPWGDGFPGWHIECSAMAMEYLGPSIDIHTGGVDHIPVHHENEIAQSEGATGKRFVNFWVHHEFLVVDGQKMSKSLGNFYTIDDIKERKLDPLAARYLFLTAHYRQKQNFTWEALEGAEHSLINLRKLAAQLKDGPSSNTYKEAFATALCDDLNIPKALAVVWDALKDPNTTRADAQLFDSVLGLDLFKEVQRKAVTPESLALAKERDELRKNKKFKEADAIRDKLLKLGYDVSDTPEGTKIS